MDLYGSAGISQANGYTQATADAELEINEGNANIDDNIRKLATTKTNALGLNKQKTVGAEEQAVGEQGADVYGLNKLRQGYKAGTELIKGQKLNRLKALTGGTGEGEFSRAFLDSNQPADIDEGADAGAEAGGDVAEVGADAGTVAGAGADAGAVAESGAGAVSELVGGASDVAITGDDIDAIRDFRVADVRLPVSTRIGDAVSGAVSNAVSRVGSALSGGQSAGAVSDVVEGAEAGASAVEGASEVAQTASQAVGLGAEGSRVASAVGGGAELASGLASVGGEAGEAVAKSALKAGLSTTAKTFGGVGAVIGGGLAIADLANGKPKNEWDKWGDYLSVAGSTSELVGLGVGATGIGVPLALGLDIGGGLASIAGGVLGEIGKLEDKGKKDTAIKTATAKEKATLESEKQSTAPAQASSLGAGAGATGGYDASKLIQGSGSF